MAKPHYLRKKKTGPPGPRKKHGVKTKRRKIFKKDGYYSSRMDKQCGHAIYLNLKNEPIVITEVITEGKRPTCTAWGDLKYVGKVTKFIKSHVIDLDDYEYDSGDYWSNQRYESLKHSLST